MVYLTLLLLIAFVLLALFTKFGPKRSTNPFWAAVFRIRTASERVFPIAFLCLFVLAVVLTAAGAATNTGAGGGSASVTNAIVTIILCICYYCLRDLGKSAKRGEVCECCGDCSKCRIQCTSNEKYYGLNRGKRKK